jgi:GT2 family glycosyltransferase
MPPLSIIIVNYRSASLIADCLHSIRKFDNLPDYEVLVIDNDSDEAGKTKVLQDFPQVRWISMKYNAGFARANNEGIRQAGSEIVLLLNP